MPGFTENWARRNRCAERPAESRVAADVTRLEYTGCADDADVVLYTIHGGGHTWPGGGRQPEWFVGATTRGVNAARHAWAFFREHPLVAGGARANCRVEDGRGDRRSGE
jgi:polyhydroxybutyrate depolymerase